MDFLQLNDRFIIINQLEEIPIKLRCERVFREG